MIFATYGTLTLNCFSSIPLTERMFDKRVLHSLAPIKASQLLYIEFLGIVIG